jgi:hypothetical protein
MDEPDFQVSYSSFNSFVECTGRQATHHINGDQYVGRASIGNPCYSKEGCDLLLCDHCLAFWWQCRENHDPTTWDTALFFRDQFEAKQVSKLFETCCSKI